MHVATVERMLDSVGEDYHALRCGCHRPLFAELGLAPLLVDFVPDERHHNCSGKHAGFVAQCVRQGWPLNDHLASTHPLQVTIREYVAQAVGLDPAQLLTGTDGCSAPNYAMPLAHLAAGYARLASGAPETDLHESLGRLADAMVARPELGSGMGRHDLDFMQAGRGEWVSKTGADGVQVVGHRTRGEAFALKIMDGSMVAQVAAAVEVMEQLGWLDDVQRQALSCRRAQDVKSARGALVGERRPVFQLQGRKS
jgi:L-asparaginase II